MLKCRNDKSTGTTLNLRRQYLSRVRGSYIRRPIPSFKTDIIGVYRTPRKKRFVSTLLKNITPAEKALKKRLRLRRAHPQYIRFHFQYIVLGFILDFYFNKAKVCVEIDGPYHETIEQREKDQQRTCALNKHGIRVIRFTNDEVINNLDWVVKRIYWFLAQENWPGKPAWLSQYKYTNQIPVV